MQFTAKIVSLPEAADLHLILVERWENVDIMPTHTEKKCVVITFIHVHVLISILRVHTTSTYTCMGNF